MYNDGVNASILNAVVVTSTVIEKVLLYLKVNLQEDKTDEKYQKELVRTVIDAGKLFKGIYGNFIAKNLMENFFTSIDFEPKFPLKAVRNFKMMIQVKHLVLFRVSIG